MKTYYGPQGRYLQEHANYFTSMQTKKDVNFLVKALHLTKKDTILDLACGNGRHVIELAARGYNIDGVDNSSYLLHHAKTLSKTHNIPLTYFQQDIHQLNIQKKYSKAYLFFSEFGLFRPLKVLKSINKVLRKGGLFLLDTDNVFRLLSHLQHKYWFNFERMELHEKGSGSPGVRYYVPTELAYMFEKSRFQVRSVYGGYDSRSISKNSKRIIITGEKK